MRWLRENIWRIAWFFAMTFVVAMWVRSFWLVDAVTYYGLRQVDGAEYFSQSGVQLFSGYGGLTLAWGVKQLNGPQYRLATEGGASPGRPTGIVTTTTLSDQGPWPNLFSMWVDEDYHALPWVAGQSNWTRVRRWLLSWWPEYRCILGFVVQQVSQPWPEGYRWTALTVPYWALVGVVLLPPAGLSIRRWRARQRTKNGCCPTCGYDLRSHAPGAHCPECGTVKR